MTDYRRGPGMKRRLTVFDLARMRHLDLLALWHRLHPDSHHGNDGDLMAQVSKEWLVTSILQSRMPPV